MAYVVKSGQTLSGIAQSNNTSVSEIARINGIKDVNKISIGQSLKMPGSPASSSGASSVSTRSTGSSGGSTGSGGTYRVAKGQTLGGIARQYGTDVATLAKLNGITNPNRISIGQMLRLPGMPGREASRNPANTYGAPMNRGIAATPQYVRPFVPNGYGPGFGSGRGGFNGGMVNPGQPAPGPRFSPPTGGMVNPMQPNNPYGGMLPNRPQMADMFGFVNNPTPPPVRPFEEFYDPFRGAHALEDEWKKPNTNTVGGMGSLYDPRTPSPGAVTQPPSGGWYNGILPPPTRLSANR